MADLIDRASLKIDTWERLSDAVRDLDKAPAVDAKPMTNGDRIRSMTDEELAEFILDKRENGTCFNNKCYYYDPNKGCDDCTLEWLKQPVR